MGQQGQRPAPAPAAQMQQRDAAISAAMSGRPGKPGQPPQMAGPMPTAAQPMPTDMGSAGGNMAGQFRDMRAELGSLGGMGADTARPMPMPGMDPGFRQKPMLDNGGGSGVGFKPPMMGNPWAQPMPGGSMEMPGRMGIPGRDGGGWGQTGGNMGNPQQMQAILQMLMGRGRQAGGGMGGMWQRGGSIGMPRDVQQLDQAQTNRLF